ncbi:MAG: hypothetical protein Q9218_002823, partial [Villophora microphyllina]
MKPYTMKPSFVSLTGAGAFLLLSIAFLLNAAYVNLANHRNATSVRPYGVQSQTSNTSFPIEIQQAGTSSSNTTNLVALPFGTHVHPLRLQHSLASAHTPLHNHRKRDGPPTLTYNQAKCNGAALYQKMKDAYAGKVQGREFDDKDLANGWTDTPLDENDDD